MMSIAALSKLAIALTSFVSVSVSACPDHVSRSIHKRAEPGKTDWAYEASYNWGRINENYTTCQTGTNQSPIPLLTTQGYARTHVPTFTYPNATNGTLVNWGYGPAFNLEKVDESGPKLTFDNTTYLLSGWHIHSPADHSVNGVKSR